VFALGGLCDLTRLTFARISTPKKVRTRPRRINQNRLELRNQRSILAVTREASHGLATTSGGNHYWNRNRKELNVASITKQANGRKLVQFVTSDGVRRTLRLGKASQRNAEEVRVRVEYLIAASASNCPLDNETARWLSKIGDDLADKLASLGLIPRRRTKHLAEFLDAYTGRRTDVKPNTQRNFLATKGRLLEFFGAEKNMHDISPGDADAWVLSLREKYSDASVALFLKRARQFFRSAVRQRLLQENPFGDLKIPSESNKSREYFLTRQDTQKALDACPDAEWRMIVALSRFGGLRCPSEHLALKWEDVQWDRDRICVRSPKTEHLDGGGERWIPLFPELRVNLEEAFELAKPGAEFVITRYRDPNANLRTQFLRIIRRAGLKAWPRLFHSLRASRQTELAAEYPLHVVCSWLGNSIRVASKHYLQVTDADFQRAAKCAAPALQNALQHPAAEVRTLPQDLPEGLDGCDLGRPVATGCELVQEGQVSPTGVEPVTFGFGGNAASGLFSALRLSFQWVRFAW
jgi:integrase